MTVESIPAIHSRRSLLAGIAGGVAGIVAGSMGRARPVAAADGQPLVLGQGNMAANQTSLAAEGNGLSISTSLGIAFDATTGANAGNAIFGRALTGGGVAGTGVIGASGGNVVSVPTKTGVYGVATQGSSDVEARGVTGQTTAGRGVNGIATTGVAVYGTATGGEGVHGTSTANNGVAGESAAGGASGVFGLNTGGGYGVAGTSADGTGVSANSTNGTAVVALSFFGTGVEATSPGGKAIVATGRVDFSTSGLASVTVGQRSKTVLLGFTDIDAASRILCTLESNQQGLFIHRVTKNVTDNSFRVFLSTTLSSGKTAKIVWFLIG